MAESVKYGSTFFIIASVSAVIIFILLLINFFSNESIIASFCTSKGFVFEERAFNGQVRGYCVFDIPCIASNISECLAVDYFNGDCTPCLFPVTDCSLFDSVAFCEQDFSPVCARVRVGVVEPFIIQERNFGNGCTACFNSRSDALVTGFINKSC